MSTCYCQFMVAAHSYTNFFRVEKVFCIGERCKKIGKALSSKPYRDMFSQVFFYILFQGESGDEVEIQPPIRRKKVIKLIN